MTTYGRSDIITDWGQVGTRFRELATPIFNTAGFVFHEF